MAPSATINCSGHGRQGGSELTDEELLQRIRQGEHDALGELYDRHAPRVVAIARRLIRDRQTVEEIVQDVFTRIWKTPAYRPELGSFENWLGVVARRIAIDHGRKTVRRLDLATGEVDAATADAHAQVATGHLGRPVEDRLDERLLRDDLARSLRTLRVEERLILQLAYFEGRTLSEIARDLALPLGTVKTRLHHGLKNMQGEMVEWRQEVRG